MPDTNICTPSGEMGSCLMKEVYPNHLSGYRHVKMHQEKPREGRVSVRRQSAETVEHGAHPQIKQNTESSWTEVRRLWKSCSRSQATYRVVIYVVVSLRVPPDWGRAASHKFPFICHRVEEVISPKFLLFYPDIPMTLQYFYRLCCSNEKTQQESKCEQTLPTNTRLL